MKKRSASAKVCLFVLPLLLVAAAMGIYSAVRPEFSSSESRLRVNDHQQAAKKIEAPPLATTNQVGGVANRTLQFRRGMSTIKRHMDKLQMMLRDEALAPDEEGVRALKKEAHMSLAQQVHQHIRRGGEPLLSDREADIEHDTIFVSVAAFRDVLCGGTIEDLFTKAAFPRRVFVGIVQQNYPGNDTDCMTGFLTNCTDRAFCPLDNIRFRRVLPHEAKGPTFGRFVAGLMYQDEKYFMMIDSHSRFAKNWDVMTLKHYRMLPTKGVISFYPPAYEEKMVLQTSHLIFMCSAHFTAAHILRMDGQAVPKPAKPLIQPYTAAGFLFGHADFVREVPFDPYLDYIFDGEEITYTIRLWTAGWDAYLPPEAIIWHYYNRHTAPRIWNVPNIEWWKYMQRSQKRIHIILNTTQPNSTAPLVEAAMAEPEVLKDLDRYGLGKERKLEDYWKFAKVDPIHRKTEVKLMDFCDSVRT